MNRPAPLLQSAIAALLLILVLGCASTQPPPGAQTVTASRVNGELLLEPATAKPGDVYIQIDSMPGISFISRIADQNDPQSAKLPISDADIESIEQQGSFMGAFETGLSVHDRNVFLLGTLTEGKYAFVVESPRSVAVLEVLP